MQGVLYFFEKRMSSQTVGEAVSLNVQHFFDFFCFLALYTPDSPIV